MSTAPFPVITDASYDHSVTIGNGNFTNYVAFTDCAMPGPAQALADYITGAHPELHIQIVEQWPLYDQDAQAANPFKQSAKVPAYIITDAAGKQLDDILAGNLMMYAQHFPQQLFDHFIEMWYGPGGTQEQALGGN